MQYRFPTKPYHGPITDITELRDTAEDVLLPFWLVLWDKWSLKPPIYKSCEVVCHQGKPQCRFLLSQNEVVLAISVKPN